MKENLESLVNEMIINLPSFSKDPTFQFNVISTILDVCTCNNYENVSNFEWLVCKVIFVLAKEKLGKAKFEKRLSQILLDIATKLDDDR